MMLFLSVGLEPSSQLQDDSQVLALGPATSSDMQRALVLTLRPFCQTRCSMLLSALSLDHSAQTMRSNAAASPGYRTSVRE